MNIFSPSAQAGSEKLSSNQIRIISICSSVPAAAIVAQAQVITTFDIDGFKDLEEYSIEPQHPDQYLLYLLSLH